MTITRFWFASLAVVALTFSPLASAQQREAQEREEQAGQLQPGEQQPGQRQAGQPQAGQQPGQRQEGQQQPGQQTGQQRRPGQQAGQQSGRGGRQSDRVLREWLIIANEGEVKLSELGQKQAKDESVKKFAQKMVKEHNDFISKLEQSGGGASGQRRAGQAGAAQERPGSERRGQGAERGEAGEQRQAAAATRQAVGQDEAQTGSEGQGQGQLNIVRLTRELGEQHVATMQHELEQKQGAEFDKLFMMIQVQTHLKMLDTLKVFEKHAAQDLQQLIKEGQESTQHHLQEARQIVQQVKGETGSAGSRTGATGTQGAQPRQPQSGQAQPGQQ